MPGGSFLKGYDDVLLIYDNKWVRGAVPALLIHCSIGSVYAWSLLVAGISEYIGKPQSLVQFAFSLAIFFLGMSAAFGGNFVEKNVRLSSLISALCFSGGLLITAGGLALKSLPVIYLGYGAVMGVGLGIGYLTPVKTLMMWFEKNKGLATGIAITGFGFASTIASPMIKYFTSHFSLETTFILFACIYFVPLMLAHLLIRKPRMDFAAEKGDFNVISMLKNKTFILIWLMVYLNINCGLALIAVASPLMAEIGVSAAAITAVVAVMGIFNGAGRLGYSAASDKMRNRSDIYRVIFIISVAMTAAALLFRNKAIIITLLLLISSSYGAGFSCMPALLSDKFGMKNISQIHGLCLSAWAVAGLTGNQMSSVVSILTGKYSNVLYILLLLYAAGLIITWDAGRGRNQGD